MMTMNLCFTTQFKQLKRWSKAFPNGKVISSLETLPNSSSVNLLWIHSPSAPGNHVDKWIRDAREKLPEVRIVVLSNTPSQQEALLALNSGAAGYCHAQSASQLLQQVATVVINGGLWIGPDLMSRILAATNQPDTPYPGHLALEQLTPREQEVALAVGRGISNKEIAQELEITERTVKAHLSAIFEKLGIRDRLQLVVRLRHNTISENAYHSSSIDTLSC